PPTHAAPAARAPCFVPDPAPAVLPTAVPPPPLAGTGWTRVAADPLTHVRTLLAPFACEPLADIPPFQGGAAGYVGYDWGAQLERIPHPRYDDLAIPDVMLRVYDWVIAWDQAAGSAWVISTGIPEQVAARNRA